MYRVFGIILAFMSFSTYADAQAPVFENESDYAPFKHMEVGVKLSTTGIGVDVATPINKNVNIRAGFSLMPQITLAKGYKMATVGSVSGDKSPEEQERRILNLCRYLSDMIGDSLYQNVDEYVDMNHQIKFCNAHVLVDWYPFKDKHWYFTAGFYVGPKSIGRAINAEWESATMVAINQYNNMYDQIQGLEEGTYPKFNWGHYSFEMDPYSGKQMINAFNEYGRTVIKLGEFPDGTPHNVSPERNGVMEAKAETNVFKPYIGCGWQTNFGFWTLSVNAGALIWGSPHVYCKDGVCLLHDVKNVSGQVGSYLNLVKKLPICPNLEVRLAYTIY